VIHAASGAKRRVNCCCSYGAWEFFRGQFQSLADVGRMFATENSEPDSVGNRYSGLTHFDALLEQTERNDPSATTKLIFRLPKSERRARPIIFFA
jgi:hypothetical protein